MCCIPRIQENQTLTDVEWSEIIRIVNIAELGNIILNEEV